MRILITIFITLFFLLEINAQRFYCWAIEGLNIRDKPSPTGKVLGKLKYGESLDIDLRKTEFSNYYEELFLVGELEDMSADINFSGSWYYIDYEGTKGYIFGGYLSRYPPFEIQKIGDEIICEHLNGYLKRNYNLISHSIAEFDSSYHDNQVRTFVFKEGIMMIDSNSDKGMGYDLIFSGMTMNEALLLIKFDFQLFKLQKNKLRSTVLEGDDYYGKKVSYDKIEINFPAPSGSITIIDTGQAIIISIWGSC